MKSTLAFPLATAALTGLAVTGLALPGTADADDPEPATRILLTVTSGATGDTESASLGCSPAGGDHPEAEAACDELDTADGDFDRLEVTPDAICPMIYDPVTATATGTYDTEPVAWKKTFSNACLLNVETGKVFAF
ncbi:SSI family serine proteinase inhibitor [Streptomyces sp. NPDC058579]|uniref:SSI family serine proteinase inhibitor n=1 Tax=Streptomyces sp. NPDC058579 TaxID=3346548 RepID=UPI0036542B21